MSKQYGVAGIDLNACRSVDEEIVASAPVSVALVSSNANSPDAITFDFSAAPIPINASDLYLQVVFLGKLGNETGAVAVATQDIPEPTFQTYINSTDYVWRGSQWYTAQQAMTDCNAMGGATYYGYAYSVCDFNAIPLTMSIGFRGYDPAQVRPTVLTPVATLAALPPGRFARLAVLVDGTIKQEAIFANNPTTFFEEPLVANVDVYPVIDQAKIDTTYSKEPYRQVRNAYVYQDPAGTPTTSLDTYNFISGMLLFDRSKRIAQQQAPDLNALPNVTQFAPYAFGTINF